ncbi:MAG TPA: radical SAM protein, partial [Candidatus Omnitrophota bacterium]|nr:radical SAM protein [Candidatus Omnitrophota bacterium]
YNTDIRLQPVGLAYLKAAAKKHLPEIRVTVRDYHQGWGRRTIPLPRDLAYLREYYSKDDKSPFSLFHHYYHFGADFETIAKETAKERPDLVGIASLFAPYHREALRCAEMIKKYCRVPILFGGSQVSAMPEAMLAHPAVDLVIRGEGERPFVELLKSLKRGRGFEKIPNLGYKKNGRMIFNPQKENFPIEVLPFPDFSDLPKGRYLFEKKPLCFIITSRGCPYRCGFCSVHNTFGHRCRRRSAEDILSEIKTRYEEGYRVFDFEDDNLSFDRKEMTELCEKLVRDFPKKDIQLLAMNGVCYWTLDRKTLKLMRRAGFTHLNLSLVSVNVKLLKSVRRPIFLKKYREVVRDAATLGFKTVVYQILGLPGDNVPSMVRTLIFNAKLPALLGASPFYLVPGSPIAGRFRACSEADAFKARLTAMAVETGIFGRDDLYTLFVITRILNFLKGIPFSAPKVPLSKALEIAAKEGVRSGIGAEILRKLLKEKIFYARTQKGFEPVIKFKPEVFFQLWRKLDTIKTLENKAIRIRGGFSYAR